jgi:SAM-dependent methyltransferase
MPETWHHGLVARWWAEFNTGGPELAAYRRYVEQGPTLDVACGTGRLLLPWLREGLDVDGCDVSADMIRLCREQAGREGLEPTLFVQAMHELEPPRAYRTMIVCGAFGLGSTRAQDQEALARLHQHLEPGGTLVLDNEAPYANARHWPYWLREERARLPEDWPPPGERDRAANGDELALRARLVSLDPLDQSKTMEIRASLWRDGELVAEEDHRIEIRSYFRDELLLLLERAGFEVVSVTGDHTAEPATADHETLVLVARKPS